MMTTLVGIIKDDREAKSQQRKDDLEYSAQLRKDDQKHRKEDFALLMQWRKEDNAQYVMQRDMMIDTMKAITSVLGKRRADSPPKGGMGGVDRSPPISGNISSPAPSFTVGSDLGALTDEEQEGEGQGSAGGSAMAISSQININPPNANPSELRKKAVAQVLLSLKEVSAALPGAAGEDAGGSSSKAPAVPIAAVVPEQNAVPVKFDLRLLGKPVYRIDIETGEVIKRFATMSEAANELKISTSRISTAVKGLKINEKSQIKRGHDKVSYQWALAPPTEAFSEARLATPPLPDHSTAPTQAEKEEIGKWIERDSTVDPNGSYFLLTLKEVAANFYMDIARDERMYNVDKFRTTSVNPGGSIKAHIAEACMLAVINKDLPPKKQKEELDMIEYLAYTKKNQIKMMGPEKGVKGYKFTFA